MLQTLSLSLFILIAFQFQSLLGEISDLRKCADTNCEVLISTGRTTQSYIPNEEGIMSFKTDELVDIYSKEEGRNLALWGVKINGRRGYAPKKFIKEESVKVGTKDLKYVVPTRKGVLRGEGVKNASGVSASDGVRAKAGGEGTDEPVQTPTAGEDVDNLSVLPPNGSDVGKGEFESEPDPLMMLGGEGAELHVIQTFANPRDAEAPASYTAVEGVEETSTEAPEGSYPTPTPPVLSGARDASEKTISPVSSYRVKSGRSDDSGARDQSPDQELEDSREGKATQEDGEEGESPQEDGEEGEAPQEDGGEGKTPREDNEERDNEDEGNGNEGEENGSEISLEPVSSSHDSAALHPDTTPHPHREEDISHSAIPEASDSFRSSPRDFSAGVTGISRPNPRGTYEMVDRTTIHMTKGEVEQSTPSYASGGGPVEGSKPASRAYYHGVPTPTHFALPPTEAPFVSGEKVGVRNVISQKPPTSATHGSPRKGEPQGKADLPLSELHKLSGFESSHAVEDTAAGGGPPFPSPTGDASSVGGTVKEEHSKNNAGFSSSARPKQEPGVEHPTPKPESGASQLNQESPENLGTDGKAVNGGVFSSPLGTFSFPGGEMSGSATDANIAGSTPGGSDPASEEVASSAPQHTTSSEQNFEGESDVAEAGIERDKPSQGIIGDPFANLSFVDPDDTKASVKDERDEPWSDSIGEPGGESSTPSGGNVEEPPSVFHIQEEESKGMNASEQDSDGTTLTDQLLDASAPLLHWLSQTFKLDDGMALAIEAEFADPRMSAGTVTFLLVVAATIVVLYLSHMIVVKTSRESPLLAMMNKLDRDQRILAEENNNLKQQLAASNGQIKSVACVDRSELQEAQLHFETRERQLEEELAETRDRNQQMETDLELLTTNQDELHRMLNELLTDQQERSNFEESVNSLQKMLDDQKEVVESLTSDLAHKSRLNDELRNELKCSRTKTAKLEYQIEQLTHSLEEVNTTKQKYLKRLAEEECSLISLKEMNDSLRQEMDRILTESEARCKEAARLMEETKRLKRYLCNKEAECQISKACLKKLQILSEGGNDVQGKLAEIFKIIETKAHLATSEKECAALRTELQESKERNDDLVEQISTREQESATASEAVKFLQKERDDAIAKLGVLTQYYEEKETQLKRELESQEGLLQNAEGSAAAISNRIQAYELELASCRSQMESLKNEMDEQRQFHKVQLTKEEKKVHDSWLAARAAERRQEELRQENAQLRQKLTQIQKESEQQQQQQKKSLLMKPQAKRVNANGSILSPIPLDGDLEALDLEGPVPHLPPPPMMPMFPGRPPLPPGLPPGLPPPPMHPHMFGHLPPPPPLPDRRLPPAGRIASPPGYDRRSYSPGSDHSHYSDQRYSPGPRYSPGGNTRGHSSPPGRRSDHLRRNANSRRDQRSPTPPDHPRRHSPERWYTTHSPQRFAKHHRSPPPPAGDYYDGLRESSRILANPTKGKTSTPLGSNDR